MAKLPQGILGSMYGKIGNVTVCRGKNGPYVRALPESSPDAPSESQGRQRSKLAVASRFLHSMGDLIALTYSKKDSGISAWNRAMSHIIKTGILQTAEGLELLYSRILVSQGDLPEAFDATAVASPDGHITFQWTNNSWQGIAKDTDLAIAVVHCAELGQSVYFVGAAERAAERVMIDASVFQGREVHTWLAFVTGDGVEKSISVYTRKLTLR